MLELKNLLNIEKNISWDKPKRKMKHLNLDRWRKNITTNSEFQMDIFIRMSLEI